MCSGRGASELGLGAADVSAIHLPDLEPTELRESAHRLAQRVARESQLCSQLALLRQPVAGPPAAGDDELPNLVDGAVGDAWGAAGAALAADVGHCASIVGYRRVSAKRSDLHACIMAPGTLPNSAQLTNIGALAYNSARGWRQRFCASRLGISASQPLGR